MQRFCSRGATQVNQKPVCLLIVGKIKREEKKLRVFCFTFGACCCFFAGKIEVGESYPIKREHVTSLRLNSSQQQFPISFFHNLLILYFQASPSLLLPHLIFFICHLKKSQKELQRRYLLTKRGYFLVITTFTIVCAQKIALSLIKKNQAFKSKNFFIVLQKTEPSYLKELEYSQDEEKRASKR